MLDIRTLREDPEGVADRLRTRDPEVDLTTLLELDDERLALLREVEALKARRNEGSQEVGERKKRGEDASDLLAEMGDLSTAIGDLEKRLREATERLGEWLAELPNVPHASVPSGGKDEGVVLRTEGDRPGDEPWRKNHLQIGSDRGLLDFARGAQIAGARFPMYVGLGARLEMALIQFMFAHHVERGYTPVWPPFVASRESLFVASQLPKFADDVYQMERDELYLNPTAESLLVNLHRGEILDGDDLPLRYVAYTPCFRREAGSYGEEERGLIRVHQFNKVELFAYTTPDDSYDCLERLIADAESVLQALGMHYRVVLLASADLAQQAAKTIDLEVFLPGQGRYYEVSSCSNCEAFQARRGSIRYRPRPKEKPAFVHTLNASGLATSRLVAALLENNQQEDGSILLPEVLRPLLGVDVL
ncbi:MAG: serine--tRNA ligase [Candidatus Bipolaricaulota bacterium]|nr:MAG: serine--tRNA ligase [Candidatus Bipolaricaulota bacterium]